MNEIKCSLTGWCTTYQEALEMVKDYPYPSKRYPYPRFSNVTCSEGWFPYLRKNGILGAYHAVCGAFYSLLDVCEGCGRRSTRKNIYYRSDVSGWMRSSFRYPALGCNELLECPETLCMSCWNKIKPLITKTKLLDEFEALIRDVDNTRLIIQRG